MREGGERMKSKIEGCCQGNCFPAFYNEIKRLN